MQKAGLFTIIIMILLLVVSTAAYVIPEVYMPSNDVQVSTGTTEATVSWYGPAPPCYECMPEPTPAPVYQTIGLSVTAPVTKVRMNSNLVFMATQTSGTPVLSTAAWDWIIQPPKRMGFSAKGQTVSTKAVSFGRWHINLNVRDSVQMLNGHVTTDITITEK